MQMSDVETVAARLHEPPSIRRFIGMLRRLMRRILAVVVAVMWAAGVCLWLIILTGCAAPLPEPLPVVEALPPKPAPATPDTTAARLVKRDSAALKTQARRYIVRPGVPIAAVVTLEPLTRAVNRSLAVMELHHTARGYRPTDVAAARAAAEAVAGFLATQGGPDAPSDAEPAAPQ